MLPISLASRVAKHVVRRSNNSQNQCLVPMVSNMILNSYSTSTPLLKQDSKNGKDSDNNNNVSKFDIVKVGDQDLTQEEMEAIIEKEVKILEAEEEAKLYKDWVPGERKRPLRFTYDLEEYEREWYPEKFKDDPLWKSYRDKRCGALGIKLGMMPIWDDWGERHACTVLWLDRNIVLSHKTQKQHGYMAIQLAAGERKLKRVGKCTMGQYQSIPALTEAPPYLVKEFRISHESHYIPIASQIHARHFVPGQNVDVSGTSKGKGFQGAMKRHNFAGMPASHGTSLSHRALGSTGQCQDPGKVFKGKKMAGRMGNDRVTVQNLRIMKIDRGRNLLYIKGNIPGQKGEFVEIRDAVKRPLWRTDLVLDSAKRPPLPTFEYDATIDGTGLVGHEEFMPQNDQDPLDPDYMDTTIVIKAEA